ncbi:BRCT domain-containing DNA repair-like protein isoform 2 [Hibiscus syriacus]|uniref:BRCT domain-containing DNA repair-like protein isoform 2 n=1 Tax=Hibiscus syriacus TaxID=106335 RepID=A0A6A2YH04_HIBSY|nr:BRCT domain-containing DNA repair-like protein isoform 2 [Hibiscus syriacus]
MDFYPVDDDLGSDKDGEFDEDGYEKTSVLYDSVVPDSPINENETQLEKVCFHTELVDEYHSDDDMGHNEIVLDSEDEGRCRIPCLDSADSIDKQLGAGKKLSSVNNNSSDGKQEDDHEIRRLQYVSSPESKESSQATALSFVDNFLSFNTVDMCQGVEERTKIKSPLVSTAKGTRRLAKIIKRGSPVKEMGAFEWFESCGQAEADSFIKRGLVSSEFGDFSHHDLYNKGSRSISNKHEEELVHLHNDIRGPSHSIFKDHCSEASTGIEKESEGNVINGYLKEFDELMPTKSSSENFEVSVTARDVPDVFDVGIGTQIAAEAMEALYYGLPPSCNSGDTCEGLENTFTDLQEGETKSTTHLQWNSLPKVAACESGEVAKESIRKKHSARRFNKDISSSSCNYNYQKLSQKVKPNRYKCKQSKVDEPVSSNNLKKWMYVSPSIPDEQTLLGKQLSRGEPVTHKSRHSEGGVTVKKNNDQVDKSIVMTNNVNEENMLTYKRKRKRVAAYPPPKLLSGKQKCSQLHSFASIEASDGRPSEQQQSCPEEASIARLLRLDSWNCPKGKRTLRKVPIHSSGQSNMHGSFTSVGAEEQNLDSVRSQKIPEDGETNSSNFYMKGQMGTNLSRLSLENSSDEILSRENCSVQVACVVTNSDLAVTSISAKDLDGAKAAQTGKLDFVDSTSIINGLKNHNFGESPRKSLESSGTEFNITLSCKKSVDMASLNNRYYVYQRRPCNRILPKSSLLKELMGLGIPDLISDFAHTGFRTRKGLAHVRVLFSQHLDDDVIKQQKKISARLGISITSCSMDATHFIADKFVRTRNMLEAIAVGKPVVTPLWLDSCGQTSCLLNEKKYILRDAKKEKEIGFNMAVSLACARQYPLLKDKKVFITQNVKPNKEMITSLVKASGGEVVETSRKMAARDQKIQVDHLILSFEQDLAICTLSLEKGAAVYSSELLLNGIVIQKLEYERHQLFPKFVKEKRAS